MTELEPALCTAEVAVLLGVHRNTVRRIPAAELPYFRIGGSRGDRRYDPADLLRYKRARRNDGIHRPLGVVA